MSKKWVTKRMAELYPLSFPITYREEWIYVKPLCLYPGDTDGLNGLISTPKMDVLEDS